MTTTVQLTTLLQNETDTPIHQQVDAELTTLDDNHCTLFYIEPETQYPTRVSIGPDEIVIDRTEKGGPHLRFKIDVPHSTPMDLGPEGSLTFITHTKVLEVSTQSNSGNIHIEYELHVQNTCITHNALEMTWK